MKIASLFIALLLNGIILFGQTKQLFEETTLEHKLIVPITYTLFEPGKSLSGRYLEHLSEGISLNIKDKALEKLLSDAPQTITLLLPSPLNISLDLYQAEVFSHDFKLKTSDGNEYDLKSEALFYRGIIKNDKNSLAVVSVFKDEIHIMYSNRDGNQRIQKTEENTYIAFKDNNILNKPEFRCGVDDRNFHEEEHTNESSDNSRYSIEECVTVYVVCDYKSYLDNGSDIQKTYLWVAKFWNEITTIYQNELIPIRVSYMYVYNSPDPFANLNTIKDILTNFTDQFGDKNEGRLKHFFTTRYINSTVGLAWTGNNIICSTLYATAVSMDLAILPVEFSKSVEVISHEMGHNLGSKHTQWCGWPGGPIDNCATQEDNDGPCQSCCLPGPPPVNGGTIMSYCPGNNLSLGFGPLPGNKIRERFNWGKNNCNLGSCLTEGDRCINAVNLPCGASIQGNTSNASWDAPPLCGPAIVGPGVWYKFTGNGQNTIISTCSSYAFNTVLNVYRGNNCNSLICVAGNDDYCSQGSQLAFSTINGAVYYVLVQGWGYGEFTITRSCTSGPNANDLYSNATTLACGQTITGNTYWATIDNNVPNCNSTITAPGVWYKFTGNGQNTIISTCPQNNTFFARLSIYKNDNGSLICVTNNDGYCFPGSQVSFNAVNGTEYFVLVHGFNNEKGEFNIKRTCVSLPPGDICSSAIQLNCGATLTGSTLNASDDPEMTLCGYHSYSFTPGIWYTFIGNGQNTTISTCTQYTFDTRLTIFSGSCVGNLFCVGRNDDFCGSASKITFPTISGVTYFVLVDGYYEQGTYTIDRTCATPITGDICSSAILLSCPDTISGSTLQAAIDPYAPDCGFNSSPGMWYKFVGNGDISKISTCSQYSFDTQLHAYKGTCDDLTCLGYNYDFCGEGSQISIDTDQDSSYYILVSGNNEQGTFEISHTCGNPVSGDECENAIELTCGTTLSGNTAIASIDLSVCGTNSNSPENTPGLWYKFVGDGKINEISITGSQGLNSVFRFMSGDCEDLICIGQGGDISTNNSFGSFPTTMGTVYYVLVRGYYSQGTFSITRTCRISSDVCSSAIELQCGDTLSGTTINSTIDNNLPICGGFTIQSPSVWYKIIGNGQVNEVSTCAGFGFNTRISVYRNQDTYLNSCDATQICIASNDDFCGQGSKVSFSTLYGATYFILVHGVGGATGNFIISRNCITAPGDNCNIALDLPCNSTINGTTVGALFDYNLPNCSLNIYEPGVWYKFTGNNQNNTISTCSAASFDTRIHIYKGSCNNLVCVSANDNYCENKSTVTFYAETGVQYFVFISGANFGNPIPGGGQGTFTITRECYNPVSNDFCANATTIACGQTISGSLLNAGPDTENTGCGNINEVGVWYKFIGDGNNTYINFTGTSLKRVFKGNCNALNCFQDYGFSNNFSFTTELDTTYYIFVYKNPSTTNTFDITRTCSNKLMNDLCSAAIELSCGVDVSGTTIGAASDGEKTSNGYPLCNNSINTAGVWYKFYGNGQNMDIFTCTSNNFFTDITIFQNECDQLMCVGDDVVYYYCGNGSKINITTIQDKQYFILIHGYNSTTGAFTIRRNCTTPAAGDNCTNAININCGQTLSGTTVGKPFDNPEVSNCLNNECCYKQRGVWYKFIGNGQVTTISTCTNTSIHTNLHIYKYDCANLECLYYDSYCTGQYGADISFLTVNNQQYYIFVESSDFTGLGAYTISRTCNPPASSTACSAAATLACGQTITTDSYNSWFPENVPFCGYEVISRANWYKFTGTGQNTVISTCSSQNANANTIISVFDGTCTNLNCITSNDNFCGKQSSVSFTALNGVEYFVLVHGTDEFEPGTFTITRSCTNDNCAAALSLPCGVEIAGSTLNAVPSNNLPFCGSSITSPGVWYKLTGDGQNSYINTCSYYNFNTKINVYEGTCSNLVCKEFNDDFCSVGSQVSYSTVNGTNYYVFVHGKLSTQGNFVLSRSCDSETLYCQSSGILSQNQWISKVDVEDFSNDSNNSSYTYFNNDTIDISRGGHTEVILTSSFANSPSPNYYKIWIDFNKDGDFNDENESLLTISNGDTIVIDTILIPQNISTGVTRMRVSLSLVNEPNSCDIFPLGEVEDYNVNIKCNLVTTVFDSGTGSLRSVANCVEEGEYVLFSATLDNEIINITNGPIQVQGNWKWKADSLLNISITAESIQRALFIPQNKSLDLYNLVFFGGNSNAGSVVDNNGQLILRNCDLYSTNNINNVTVLNKGILEIFGYCKIK